MAPKIWGRSFIRGQGHSTQRDWHDCSWSDARIILVPDQGGRLVGAMGAEQERDRAISELNSASDREAEARCDDRTGACRNDPDRSRFGPGESGYEREIECWTGADA